MYMDWSVQFALRTLVQFS